MFHHVNEPPLLRTTRAALRPGEDVLLVGRPNIHFDGSGIVGRVRVACCPWCHDGHTWPWPSDTTPQTVFRVRMPCPRGPYQDGAVYLGLTGGEVELYDFLKDLGLFETLNPRGRRKSSVCKPPRN
jgi:hypothetical protein